MIHSYVCIRPLVYAMLNQPLYRLDLSYLIFNKLELSLNKFQSIYMRALMFVNLFSYFRKYIKALNLI
jgi:hypothetical protein